MGRVTDRRRVLRVRTDGSREHAFEATERPDTLVVEEPLEIRLDGAALSVTMRTPGDDFDLVAGFLATEGVLRTPDDLASMRYCDGVDELGRPTYNVVDAALAAGVPQPTNSLQRNFYTTSSCGVCGKASIDAIRTQSCHDVAIDPLRLSAETVLGLPDALRAAQRIFDRTGGLHAAGLFDEDGRLVVLREDVGRHNAVDKVVGWALRERRLPLSRHVLQVSGRASFELTQKALMAGIPVLSAVSAPSTLAVDLAAQAGMTLLGFVRGRSFNVYSGAERIESEQSAAAQP